MITWIRAGNRYPYFKAERNQFLALDDDDDVVGMVRLIEQGPEGGRWTWSMAQVHSGRPFSRLSSGTTESRKEAQKALVATWQEFRESYGIEGK